MLKIYIPKDDYGYGWEFHIRDHNDNVVDITTYTVTLKVWSTDSGTLAVDAACANTTPTLGIATYTIQSGDFDTAGTYSAELELTKTGVIASTVGFEIIVVDSG